MFAVLRLELVPETRADSQCQLQLNRSLRRDWRLAVDYLIDGLGRPVHLPSQFGLRDAAVLEGFEEKFTLSDSPVRLLLASPSYTEVEAATITQV